MPDLTELQRLAEGATPGPWEAYTDCPGECCWLIRQPPEDDGDFTHEGVTWPETSKEDAAYIAAMHPDTAKKLIAAAEALELMLDCSSQEWQQADGKRMAATDNQGRRFWFITEDVMQAARTALEELK